MTDTTARPSSEAADPQETPTTAPANESDDALAVASREAAELKDKLLRTLAEMENLRRRTEREVADARVYGIAGFARDVLGVADNMQRALQSAQQELRGSAEPGVRTLLEGVELIEREVLKMLEKHGIRKFDPQGEKFDPNLHQAMYEVEDASMPAGTIAQVIQPGYMIGERMLRPALVAVAKASQKLGDASPVSPDGA